jgi:hypothetical protein
MEWGWWGGGGEGGASRQISHRWWVRPCRPHAAGLHWVRHCRAACHRCWRFSGAAPAMPVLLQPCRCCFSHAAAAPAMPLLPHGALRVQEAQMLLDAGLVPNSNCATRAIGYRQALEFLAACRAEDAEEGEAQQQGQQHRQEQQQGQQQGQAGALTEQRVVGLLSRLFLQQAGRRRWQRAVGLGSSQKLAEASCLHAKLSLLLQRAVHAGP